MASKRGRELRAQLAELLESARPAHEESLRRRRRSSVGLFEDSCGFFVHASELRQGDGLLVPRRHNSAHTVRNNHLVVIDTLNAVRGQMRTRVDELRALEVAVLSKEGDVAAVELSGTSPYAHPEPARHATVLPTEASVETMARRLGLTSALERLARGETTAIPLYANIMEFDATVWERDGPHRSEYEVTALTHPRVYAELVEAASRGDEVLRLQRVPKVSTQAWARIGGHNYFPKMGSYRHATAVVLTRSKVASVVDSNDARPPHVERAFHSLFAALGFRVEFMALPSINQEDARDLTDRLRTLDVHTPVRLAGYCASLSMAYLVDVLCTGRHYRDHAMRLYEDVGSEDPLAIVLFARAIAAQLVNLCVARLHKLGIDPAGPTWPRSFPTKYITDVVRITI